MYKYKIYKQIRSNKKKNQKNFFPKKKKKKFKSTSKTNNFKPTFDSINHLIITNLSVFYLYKINSKI